MFVLPADVLCGVDFAAVTFPPFEALVDELILVEETRVLESRRHPVKRRKIYGGCRQTIVVSAEFRLLLGGLERVKRNSYPRMGSADWIVNLGVEMDKGGGRWILHAVKQRTVNGEKNRRRVELVLFERRERNQD